MSSIIDLLFDVLTSNWFSVLSKCLTLVNYKFSPLDGLSEHFSYSSQKPGEPICTVLQPFVNKLKDVWLIWLLFHLMLHIVRKYVDLESKLYTLLICLPIHIHLWLFSPHPCFLFLHPCIALLHHSIFLLPFKVVGCLQSEKKSKQDDPSTWRLQHYHLLQIPTQIPHSSF